MAIADSRLIAQAEAVSSGLRTQRHSWSRFSWRRAFLLTSLLVALLAMSPEPYSVSVTPSTGSKDTGASLSTW